MSTELAQISFYLAKPGSTFSSMNDPAADLTETANFKIRTFKVDGAEIKFFCFQSPKKKPNPPWLDFINEKILPVKDRVHFDTFSKRPSGLLLIKINSRVLAAVLGVSGATLLNKKILVRDFGIKTAMNMCGNTELRQTRSRTHAITTQNIDRQLSQPSEAFDFGLADSELLKSISAHMQKDKNVTLQGKDSLTIKIVGEEKLTWERLLVLCRTFLLEYEKDDYKKLFPNYPNLQNVTEEQADELDERLLKRIVKSDFKRFHLAIPEFIADDDHGFAYSNSQKRENIVFSHLQTKQLEDPRVFKHLDKIDVEKLKSKTVYAYSYTESRILPYKKWSLYDCIVAEDDFGGGYFVLSEGEWRKLDKDFYDAVNQFIDKTLVERPVPSEFHNINIFDAKKKQNREELFNQAYCRANKNAILFDKAKLRISQSRKNKEFCDILELNADGPMNMIHVKKHGGCSAINYLFSQSRFYCEFFLSDQLFLGEIRQYINDSGHKLRTAFLKHIKPTIADVSGKDYDVSLWVLYDSAQTVQKKSDLPLMAKYEMKLTYERLRNLHKVRSVSISMIPVKMANVQIAKSPAGTP